MAKHASEFPDNGRATACGNDPESVLNAHQDSSLALI